jgi:hypothetical protein
MSARLREATVKASGSPGRAYSPPSIVPYGRLRSLTTAGTEPGNENQPGQDNNKKSIPRP